MSRTVESLVEIFEELWPLENTEPWDVVGLVLGQPKQVVSKVLMTVDATAEVAEYAIQNHVDLILAHHPLLLKGVTNVSEDTAKGAVVSRLIKAGVALYTAHTNADVVSTGTSMAIANALGLKDTKPLGKLVDENQGAGVQGEIEPISLGELAARLNDFLPPTASGVRVAGDFDRPITKIALCAGAGDSYLQLALDSGADVYITSDLRHHPAQEIIEQAKARGVDFSLVDISHWAAEFIWLDTAKNEIQSKATSVEIEVCDIRTDVFDFLMNKPKNL